MLDCLSLADTQGPACPSKHSLAAPELGHCSSHGPWVWHWWWPSKTAYIHLSYFPHWLQAEGKGKHKAYLQFCSSLITVWYSQLPLVLQKCSNGSLLLRWTLTPSPQRVAKGHSRAIHGNNRLLLVRLGVGRSMFEKMSETFQKNLILLWCQPSREQHKKLDYLWVIFQMTSCISLTDNIIQYSNQWLWWGNRV